MKKTILIAALLVGMATTSFAAQVSATSAGSTLGTTVFKTSQGVRLFATATITAYTAASKHDAGDTIYKTSSDSATIDEVQNPNYKGDAITSEVGAGPA